MWDDFGAPSALDAEAARLTGMLGAEISPRDFASLDAQPVVYGITDRPLANGRLPEVSAAGSPARLAQIADPKDPLGDTGAEATARRQFEHRAEVYSAATYLTAARRTPHSPGQPTRTTVIPEYEALRRKAGADDV